MLMGELRHKHWDHYFLTSKVRQGLLQEKTIMQVSRWGKLLAELGKVNHGNLNEKKIPLFIVHLHQQMNADLCMYV